MSEWQVVGPSLFFLVMGRTVSCLWEWTKLGDLRSLACFAHEGQEKKKMEGIGEGELYKGKSSRPVKGMRDILLALTKISFIRTIGQ
jgi:hypothetical protein